ncbi:hypothetical protein ACLS0R_16755 [Comamonas jiangduensis]|uniref:hypothetical protein n=1 Tax=Comamonas jiangduensis TaxID=1194168 RepID=UPI003BF83CC6
MQPIRGHEEWKKIEKERGGLAFVFSHWEPFKNPPKKSVVVKTPYGDAGLLFGKYERYYDSRAENKFYGTYKAVAYLIKIIESNKNYSALYISRDIFNDLVLNDSEISKDNRIFLNWCYEFEIEIFKLD